MLFPKNLFITGLPRSGKTTLVKRLSQDADFRGKMRGFYTDEMRSGGNRIGFKIVTIPEGKEGILAKKNILSQHRVGSYGVLIKNFEVIACPEIRKGILERKTIVIDEIGKMELFSSVFTKTLILALDSPQKVLATVMRSKNALADELKQRNDVFLLELTRKNFDSIFLQVKSWLQ